MRFPSLNAFVRTLYAFSNSTSSYSSTYTRRFSISQFPLIRTTTIRSMPAIPFFSSLFSTKAKNEKKMSDYPVNKSDNEWQAVLSPEQFRVLRQKGTEAPGSSALDSHYPDAGVYTCAACDAPLYRASHKFKSGCGWPAYFDSIPGAVERHEDSSMFMKRTEIVCAKCGGHLGHVFKGEGFKTPTDERHCVNGISLKFTEDAGKESKA